MTIPEAILVCVAFLVVYRELRRLSVRCDALLELGMHGHRRIDDVARDLAEALEEEDEDEIEVECGCPKCEAERAGGERRRWN